MPERISQAAKVFRSIAIETKSDMEIDLLLWRQTISTTRIKQVARATMVEEITDILDKRSACSLTLFSITKVYCVLT